MIPIVDTHQHLWDLNRFRIPWVDSTPALNKTFLMTDYLDATRDLNVVKTVYMEVDVDPSQQQGEASYVSGLCREADNPMVAAVVSGRPGSPGFKSFIAGFKDNARVKGVRRVLHTQPPGICVEPNFVKGIRLLGEMGLSFDVCCLPAELSNAVKLIDQCSHTRFVLDHCGNAKIEPTRPGQKDPALLAEAQQWRNDLSAMADRPNVICKISGIVAGAGEGWTACDLAPAVNHCLDTFGPDRVVFGGDWPVCTLAATYRQWVGALKEIVGSRPEVDQRKLFHDNAVRHYGLS